MPVIYEEPLKTMDCHVCQKPILMRVNSDGYYDFAEKPGSWPRYGVRKCADCANENQNV